MQGLIDYQDYNESLRKKMRFDHRTLTFVTRVHKTSTILKRKLHQLRFLISDITILINKSNFII